MEKKLFKETKLSADNTISCESCHDLSNYGIDSLSVSVGIHGQKGKRNTPTVYNSSYNFVQFWDGRAADLKEQALLPVTTPFEMGETLENVVKKLKQDSEYRDRFKALYNGGVKAEHIADALAEFQKSLITPHSRFDRYLRGEDHQFNEQEKRGLSLFRKYGCISCHNGINIGGNLFQRLGYFSDRTDPLRDKGRYHVTKLQRDLDIFKVPSLRNVAMTAPYFHDGKIKTLKEAVKTMAAFQLGRIISDEEIEDIVAFLKTLTGELPYEQ